MEYLMYSSEIKMETLLKKENQQKSQFYIHLSHC